MWRNYKGLVTQFSSVRSLIGGQHIIQFLCNNFVCIWLLLFLSYWKACLLSYLWLWPLKTILNAKNPQLPRVVFPFKVILEWAFLRTFFFFLFYFKWEIFWGKILTIDILIKICGLWSTMQPLEKTMENHHIFIHCVRQEWFGLSVIFVLRWVCPVSVRNLLLESNFKCLDKTRKFIWCMASLFLFCCIWIGCYWNTSTRKNFQRDWSSPSNHYWSSLVLHWKWRLGSERKCANALHFEFLIWFFLWLTWLVFVGYLVLVWCL